MSAISILHETLSKIVQRSGFVFDNRTVLSHLKYIENYTCNIPYVPDDNLTENEINTWADYLFMDGKSPEVLAELFNSASLENVTLLPHQAFLMCMLKMLQMPKAFMNYFPDAHRDLYFRQLLGLEERPAEPSNVALNFVLDGKVSELILPAGTLFDAGHDRGGTRIEFRLDNDLLVNKGTLSDMRWCRSQGVANGATSAIIYGDQRSWPANGIHLFNKIDSEQNVLTGTFIASSKLMNVKSEQFVVKILFEEDLPNDFCAHVSSGKEWLRMSVYREGSNTFQFILDAEQGEVSTPDELLGIRFDVPVIRLLVENGQYIPSISRIIIGSLIISDKDYQQMVITPFGYASLAQPVDDMQLYIGFRDLEPGQSLSLYWNIDHRGQPLKVHWEYLARGNRWLSLDDQLIDNTHGLVFSGIWSVTLPRDASNNEYSMPAHRYWFRALIQPVNQDHTLMKFYPLLIGVLNNCMTAQLNNVEKLDEFFFENSYDGDKVLTPIDDIPGIAKVYQPWKTWGGRPSEGREQFIRSVAYRLSHRNRALTWSDMELLLKSKFPELLDVIIPFRDASNTITGQLQQKLIVLPRVEANDNDDSFRPMFNPARLEVMSKTLQSLASLWQKIKVVNPSYRDVLVTYKLIYRSGVNPSWAEQELRNRIIDRYMPWCSGNSFSLPTLNRIDYYAFMAFLQQSPHIDHVTSLMLDGKEESIIGANDQVLVLCWPD